MFPAFNFNEIRRSFIMKNWTTFSTTTAICSSFNVVVGLVIYTSVFVWFYPKFPFSALLPQLLMCSYLGFASGLLLAIVYSLWTMLVFMPLYWLLGWHYLIAINLPILVFCKNPSKKASRVHILLLNMLWDYPQMIWIHLASVFGIRALKVCMEFGLQHLFKFNYAAVHFSSRRCCQRRLNAFSGRRRLFDIKGECGVRH